MAKVEYNAITEFINNQKSEDIKLWIYTMPIKDIQNKHKENSKVVYNLKKYNPSNPIIVFNEHIIASFEKINIWEDIKYIKEENRNIDILINTERKILERLLLAEIKSSIDKNIFEGNGNSIILKKPVFENQTIIAKRKVNFDVNIENDSSIIIGFELSHDFEYKHTLEKDIELNNISQGEKVKDPYNNINYTFKELADFTIADNNEYMQQSIIDYYNNRNQNYIVSKFSPNIKAVLVETNNGNIYPYIPNRLKKVCNYANLPSDIISKLNKYIKLKPHDKMKTSIDMLRCILPETTHIKFEKKNILIENLNYKKEILNNPRFIFRNEKIHNYIKYGLKEHGAYENKDIEINYFIDPSISRDLSKNKIVKSFANEVETYSKELGINIKRVSTNIPFKDLNVDNKDVFEAEIRGIIQNYNNPTIVILEDSNAIKYYPTMKKIFGNKNNIATQFVTLSTLNYNEKNKSDILLNILLGVYAKSGIQPWILKEPLSADCYIGLDVSRENKRNTAGVIQIIGKDGRVLKSKSITSSQSGEKINIETVKEILQEANYSYKKFYGASPKHIVFHRDGISREELDLLKESAKNLNIKFDYIEVTKDINRRIAILNEKNEWETKQGLCYTKDNKAYMLTTNPHNSIGMAQPLRVRKVYGEQHIETIVKDIYKLSFMHIGSIIKARLPVTTHYADLSSTFGNRELMPSNLDSNSLHFI